ncbi:MAG: hypothetical protein WBH57_10740 [Anaerolineae bacterium]
MGTAFIFDGKDEYVCHPGAEDMLGSFQLSIEAGYQYAGSPYEVSYFVSADRISPLKGIFEFRVIEPPEQTAQANSPFIS